MQYGRYIKAHQPSAGADSDEPQAVGKSRAGQVPKIHRFKAKVSNMDISINSFQEQYLTDNTGFDSRKTAFVVIF